MTLPVPLTVALQTSTTYLHVTRQLRSLSFRESAIGGFTSLTMSIDRPLGITSNEIAYYGKVYIYAGSVTIWEGRIEDLGKSAGTDGEVWELVAMGPAVHAHDRSIPLIYVDTTLTDMRRSDNVTPGGTDSVTEDPGGSGLDSLVLQMPSGTPLVTNSRVTVRYLRVREAGQKLARVDYAWDAGRISASLLVQLIARQAAPPGADTPRSQTFTTAGGAVAPTEIGADWTSGRDMAEFRIIWTGGASTVGDDITWAALRTVSIVATRYSKTGTELVTAADYSANTVLASEIVADLLGRLLPLYDGANATITTTSYAIDQLAYPDGVDAGRVLDDLMRLNQAYRWGAYATNPTTGKYRFEWIAWPTVVRYEADVIDGFDAPSSADDLYNEVRVRWRDPKGLIRSTTRTSSVPVLTAAGITRSTTLDLGDNIGSSAAADQAGDQFLADHQYPRNAGTLTVARKILDVTNGKLVSPWAIKAGELIRVRGVVPNVDSLNLTDRDGSTTFRIWEKAFDADRAAAVLSLDSYSASTAQALADLNRPELRRR